MHPPPPPPPSSAHPHAQACAHAHWVLRVLRSTFLRMSLSLRNAFAHDPTTTEPLRCPELPIAQAAPRSKVCYSSESASWAANDRTDSTRLCMCVSLQTHSKSAFTLFFARRCLCPNPLVPVTQSTVYKSGIRLSIHTRPRGHSESMETTLSHADHLSSPSWVSWAVLGGSGAPRQRNSIAMPLFLGTIDAR